MKKSSLWVAIALMMAMTTVGCSKDNDTITNVRQPDVVNPAEFRFSPQLSLYAEPGLGYWFDNGSDIPTYYQDKPLSFSLSLGLRLNLWDNN